ncbi:MAG TPA: hypothetical protein VFQ07_08520, partial [Candidatus Polarisedimenticolia bacterium]|nr:hypothetical protein [Candidatus Polarisedimenticolia bacterium]
VRDMEMKGKGLHALADMKFDGKSTDGLLYVRLHGFSLGIEKTAAGRDLKIVRPLAWFEKRRAARRAVPSGVDARGSRQVPEEMPSSSP